ncbi:Mu-F like minor capsid protein [Microbacterium phage Rasputia]|nr:Mu-F like minor capsid protein [Microbacterium phage Rasputia]
MILSNLADLDVSSPGGAFGRQAAVEANLRREAETALRSFMAGILSVARSRQVQPPDVHARWRGEITEMLSHLPREMSDYVGGDFLGSEIPDAVYDTTRAIYAAAGTTYATAADVQAALERALSVDGFAVEQISASYSPGTAEHWVDDPDHDYATRMEVLSLVAAGFWDALQDTGSVWIKRIRRTVRTTATGMVSRFTVTAIRLQDYPMKRWVTRHDDRVRLSHRHADGQTVPVGQPFTVGGTQLMYPGEREALFGEVVNCRCTLIGVR